MNKINNNYLKYIILWNVVIVLFLINGCAENVAVRKPVNVSRTKNAAAHKTVSRIGEVDTKQTINKELSSKNEAVKSDEQKDEGFLNSNSRDDLVQQETDNEDKQEMMEKALDLLEVADKLWQKGDIEETLDTLDEAYALLLDANGDSAIAQEKDDLRLLISQRIMAVYSSKRNVLNGKNGEIPLIMNDDVEKEIRSFQGLERDNFIAAYQRSGLYRPIIIKELKKAGIPEEFFWLPLVESFFKINAYSRARALGLWQFIPSTGYKFGLNRDEWIDERMDVQKSTLAAIAYLKELHNMFGDWMTVLAAYNCGEGRVLRVISRQHINYLDGFWDLYRQLPNETARYVPRFLATLHIVKDPQKYGFDLGTPDKPINYEMVSVNKVMKLKDIAEKIEVQEESLSLLNSELRFKTTPDHGYNLKIPEGSLQKFNLVANEIPESEKPQFASSSIRTPSVRPAFIKHRVKKGETIYSIARKYNVSVAKIKSYNRLGFKKKLAQGRSLTIPIPRGKYYAANDSSSQECETVEIRSTRQYKVKKGETLSMVAHRLGIPVSQIKKMNNLKSEKVYAGQTLKLVQNKTSDDSDNTSTGKGKKLAKTSNAKKSVLSSKDVKKLGTNTYIVTKRDNIHSIAKKNNIKVSKLMKLNNITQNDKIVPGQILIIK